jgi:MFS family permease
MARYNDQLRGKALSISGIGYPLGEAILPSMIAGVLVLFHWRTTWALIALVIAIFFIPVLWFLIRSEKTAVDDEIIEEDKPSASDQYKLLATDTRTWYVVPAILMPPFWVTGLFLYQVSAADQLGWSAALIASAFVAFAATRIATGLFSGPVIDRFSAKSIFPFLLIPMIIGLLVGFFFSGGWAAFVYLGLIGATMGFSSTIKSALWAEMYGTKVIGTVQSAFASLMVFSTALSPFLVGWLLDQSVSMNSILMIAVISSVLAGLLSLKIMPVFSGRDS